MFEQRMRVRRPRWQRAGALAIAAAMALAACGDDGDDDAGGARATATTTATSGGPNTTAAGQPERGGVITVGQYSAPPGLDPAKLQGGGTVGGMEHFALYDVIMGYDNETDEYEPRTAESLEPNGDFSVWTLKLKPGIRFTDGTAYDAEAVKFVHERQMREGAASPRGMFTSTVASVDVVDPLTVRYTLTQPFTGFPYLLAGVNGIIYSPTAFRAAGDTFNATPGNAGAGPFKLKSYMPGESIELERNPDYYGGEVHLDGLIFRLNPGAPATWQAIETGAFQAGFVRDPAVIDEAKGKGYGAIEMPSPAGATGMMNSGIEITCGPSSPSPACAGKAQGETVKPPTATADVRVRQAVAHAIDAQVISDRVYRGAMEPSTAPFADSPWDPGVEGPAFDQAESRRLIAEARADGWDGRIRVLAGNDPTSSAWGQAVAAMLEAVGMDVELDTSKDIAGVVNQILVIRDYDITTWSIGLLDESDRNYHSLQSSWGTGRYGYRSPDMDAAIDLLRTADTQDERVAAYRAVSEVWIRDMPAFVTGAVNQAVLHTPDLHGATRTAESTVLFDDAWLEQ
jgi:peptide/nickel transport system substrate-binding protein